MILPFSSGMLLIVIGNFLFWVKHTLDRKGMLKCLSND
jgi:hypothetical protein